MTRYLTLKEAANRQNFSERQMRQLCKEGKVQGAHKAYGGRKWLIPEDALEVAAVREIASKEAITQEIQRHWNKLADMAGKAAEGFYLRLIGRDFWDMLKVKDNKYKDTKSAPGVGRWLSETVLEILHPLEPFDWKKSFADELGSTTRKHSLIVHLDSEFPGFSDKLQDWKKYSLWYKRWTIAGDEAELPYKPSEIDARLQNLTDEIIEVLNIVAERRTFKGTCDICKD